MSNQFVVKRLRSQPVEYTVTISHAVIGGEWQVGLSVSGVNMDAENRERVAFDLRAAADRIESEQFHEG